MSNKVSLISINAFDLKYQISVVYSKEPLTLILWPLFIRSYSISSFYVWITSFCQRIFPIWKPKHFNGLYLKGPLTLIVIPRGVVIGGGRGALGAPLEGRFLIGYF
uniref:Uncharacterized protein n=1 Tax=Cacopsylla melanoneura TaxID=428564 RepID=A0A8D9FBA3_9HEMI